jgi:hypothetical protein
MIPHLSYSDVNWDSVHATHWIAQCLVLCGRRALGKGGTRSDSLIVVVNCGHSWCLRGSHVSCCQVISIASCILISISATLLDMSDDLAPHPNIVIELQL